MRALGFLVAGAAIAATAGVAEAPLAGLSAGQDTGTLPQSAQSAGGENPFGTEAAVPLYLKVYLNRQDTGLLASVLWYPRSGVISMSAAEMEDVGISAPRHGTDIQLGTVPGLSYQFDETAQALHLFADPDRLRHRTFHGLQRPEFTPPSPGFGAVLNYRFSAGLGNDLLAEGIDLQAMNAYLDGRIYAPFGVLRTTGTLDFGDAAFSERTFRRFETNFSSSNPATMLTFVAGDINSSGQNWTRPIRMGGVQIRRDFSLRSDIVTDPQLSYSGTALLPTAVDVYVDNVNAWSGSVPPGPFTLTDLPVIGRAGEAEVVIRDASGSEERKSISFFNTENLLNRGRFDFSLEAGVARNGLGDGTPAYGKDRIVSGSLRFGLTDRLTLLGHVEGTPGLVAASGGISTVIANRAELSLSLGTSRFDRQTGHLGHLSLRTEVAGVAIRFSSTRHSDDYADLAFALGVEDGGEAGIPVRPARAQDVLSVSLPVFKDGSSASFNLINLDRFDSAETIFSASYSRTLGWREADLRLSGFTDLTSDNFGISFGMSMPLGKKSRAYAGLRSDEIGGLRQSLTTYRRLDRGVGQFGYRVTIDRNEDGAVPIDASVAYRSRLGLLEARAQQGGDGRVTARTELEGALVLNEAGLMAGNSVGEAFTVVDLGVAGIPVKLNNTTVATTGPAGKALVPDLTPYQRNRLSVDPAKLPLNANLNATAMETVPARNAGTTLRMGRGISNAALIVLRTRDGAFVPMGAAVRVNGRMNDFVVGYDGEVWLEHLAQRNSIAIDANGARCAASFDLPSEETGYLEVTCD